MKENASLKKVYYLSFLIMIVIPILLVLLIAMNVIRRNTLRAAVVSIENAHDAVAGTLGESIRDNALLLSHFVYVNDRELLALAAGTDTDNVADKYRYSSDLSDLFQVAMAPKQSVISGMIYLNSGKSTYLKQDVNIPQADLIQADWYQQALAKQNHVTVGLYDTGKTKIGSSGTKKNQLVLAVAMAPDHYLDRSGKVEMVVLFFQTRLGDLIQSYKKSLDLDEMVILDEAGKLVFGQPGSAPAQRGMMRIATPIPETGWQLCSRVETAQLTGSFNQISSIMIFVTAILFLLYYLFSKFFLGSIINPIQLLVVGLKQVEEGDLDTRVEPAGNQEIRTMMTSFNQTVSRLKATILEKERANEEKMEADIRALQSQINPHFLVNTLNSIRFMAQVSKFDGIRKMAEALINILSCSFRSNISFYTVAEELKVLESYLYLMRIRYSGGFEVEYQVADDCRQLLVPRLVLQPLVENSIVHGFTELEEELGLLKITIAKAGEQLCLEVWDNGKGMSQAAIARVFADTSRAKNDNYSIGLENVCSRLRLKFKEHCSFVIESEVGVFTRMIIRLPAVEEGNWDEPGRDC